MVKKTITVPDPTNSKWEKKTMQKVIEENAGCPERDQHSSCFDDQGAIMYVFGGYVKGDKANDMWLYSLNESKWTCLHEGDYL